MTPPPYDAPSGSSLQRIVNANLLDKFSVPFAGSWLWVLSTAHWGLAGKVKFLSRFTLEMLVQVVSNTCGSLGYVQLPVKLRCKTNRINNPYQISWWGFSPPCSGPILDQTCPDWRPVSQ